MVLHKWVTSFPENPFSVPTFYLFAASAGAGKTTELEKQICSLIESGTDIGKILYITYNRKVADEFRARLLSKYRFEKSQIQFINTFHSVALHQLSKHIGRFGIFDERNRAKFLEETKINLGNSLTLKAYESMQIKRLRRNPSFTSEELHLLHTLIEAEVSQQKKTHTSYLFECIKGDLFPDVDYQFIDEAQDIPEILYDLLLKHSSHLQGTIFAGDDKQAINAFRAGDGKQLLNTNCDVSVTAETTYRVPRNILKFANSIGTKISEHSPLIVKSAKEHDGDVIFAYNNPSHAAKYINDAVRAGSSVLILARDHRIKSAALHRLIRPFSTPIFTTAHQACLDIFRLFRRVHETGYFTHADLLSLRSQSENDPILSLPFFVKGYWKTIDALLNERQNQAQSSLFSLVKEYEEQERFLFTDAPPDGVKQALMEDFIFGAPSITSFKKGFQEAASDIKNWISKYGIEMSSAQLMTYHESKGLEAEVVVMLTDMNYFSHKNLQSDPDIEHRLDYVGSTRASRTLIITNVTNDFKTFRPS